jgi:hypothetical protein
METSVVLSFTVNQMEGHEPEVLSLTPVLSGIPLTELVESFERQHGFEPTGGYRGLIPMWFGLTPPSPPPGYGSLEHYFIGRDGQGHRLGHSLLECQCGNVGCWPLCARIVVAERTVVWDSFRQPHRPLRDYSDFGPFIFDAEQYRKAVIGVAANNPELRFAWEDERD